ncbi:MAG: 6-phosphogluconolactonase [Bacteroidetes bacterium]|nr:6-phosphogluconolactonase [Bacteroidota bacterium]
MTTNTEVKIYATPKKVYKAIAKEIFRLTQNSSQPRFDIALSGGNSPKGLFEKISKKYADSIPWDRIHFWWGDERCVSPESNESNYKMTTDYLLSNISISKDNIHRIQGEANPEKEAKRYSEEINSNLYLREENPVFDLIILGLGDDGHTASIFPDQIELFEDEKICVVAQHPITGQKRVSLSGKVLNNASRIFFLVTGENKSMRISEIMNDSAAAKLLPAYYISPKNGELIWFLDEPAASKI